MVSYYASLLAYGEKHFREADRYADIALNDSNMAEDAAEIKINCMRELMRTPLDSSRYELALLALHDNAPGNAAYFHLLTDFLSRPGHEGELENFAKDELAKDSLNANIWSLWGEINMRKHNWDEAIVALEKPIQLTVRRCRSSTILVSAGERRRRHYGGRIYKAGQTATLLPEKRR